MVHITLCQTSNAFKCKPRSPNSFARPAPLECLTSTGAILFSGDIMPLFWIEAMLAYRKHLESKIDRTHMEELDLDYLNDRLGP